MRVNLEKTIYKGEGSFMDQEDWKLKAYGEGIWWTDYEFILFKYITEDEQG